MAPFHRARDVVDAELGADEIAPEHDADLVLEARLDEVVVAELTAALDPALAEQAAEDRLVHLELLLDGLRGEAHLPADVGDAAGAAPRDEPELDAIGVVEVEPTLPSRRKVDTARALRPELVDHLGQPGAIQPHAAPSGGSSTTRAESSASATTLPTFGAVGSRALRTTPDSSATSTSYSRPWYSTSRTVPRATLGPRASSVRRKSSGRTAASTAAPAAPPQHARLDHQRPRDGHALLLTAGELRGIARLEPLELHERQHAAHALVDLRARHAPHVEAEGHVVEDGEVREERVVLEDHPESAALGRQGIEGLVVEPDLAGARREQAGEEVEGGGLAAARGTEEGDELAAAHLEREVVEDVLRAEVLAQAETQAADHPARIS